MGLGSVFARTTQRFQINYYHRELNKEMGRNWLAPRQYLVQLKADARKPVKAWRETYRDSNEPVLFRRWLNMVLSPQNQFDIGEGFGFSPIASHSGLLTYRYLKLFTGLDERLYQSRELSAQGNLMSVFNQESFVDAFIRNEHLESDLVAALEKAGIAVTESQKSLINNAKGNRTNASKRRTMEHYYDQASIDLVYNRESLIINRHNYRPPNI